MVEGVGEQFVGKGWIPGIGAGGINEVRKRRGGSYNIGGEGTSHREGGSYGLGGGEIKEVRKERGGSYGIGGGEQAVWNQ